MKFINPLLLVDGYKLGHIHQYPKTTQYIYSNLTARESRDPKTKGEKVVFYGLQYFILKYLINDFNEYFFRRNKDEVVSEYKETIDRYVNPDNDVSHIAALHDLGYLPLHIKSLEEGSLVDCGIPLLTIVNTDPDFYWLTNTLETLLLSVLWKMCTNATTAHIFKKEFLHFEKITSNPHPDATFSDFQAHDFSFRSMSGPEDSARCGSAHLLSFKGTDSLPAVMFAREYYGIDNPGTTIPATEHSVMCVGGDSNELETYKRLLTDVYPSGPVSIVSDTWDFWNVLTNILPLLHDTIIERDGKVVIRPDSGDPVDIICGTLIDTTENSSPQEKGTVQVLFELFGGTENNKGFIQLHDKIGCIYGDAITPKIQTDILTRLQQKGFASTNIVLGIGGYSYQYTTRDDYGFAMKATNYIDSEKGSIPIFKDPKTSKDTHKKSHKGLLRVDRPFGINYTVAENCTIEQEEKGLLKTVFKNGKLIGNVSFADIRDLLKNQYSGVL